MMENMKTDREETLRASAKLFLNSLYGTMATSNDSSFKAAYMNENGYVGFNTIIFAIREALANYYSVDKAGFIYADTDSIHCDLNPEQIRAIGMRENMKTDREETFRHYMDKILDAMNVSSIDYDKLNCIMHDANMDFIYDNLTYKQIATITHWIKNIMLVKNREEQ